MNTWERPPLACFFIEGQKSTLEACAPRDFQGRNQRAAHAIRNIKAQIRAKSPRYAALTQPQPLGVKEIQDLLDPDTLLLECALGDERSYLWAVTPSTITTYELSPRKEVEGAARRVYELMTLAQDARGRRAKQLEVRYWLQAARLSQMVLEPVAAQLENKRLVIVADGALPYIPFAALPRPVSLVTGHWSLARKQPPRTNDQRLTTNDQEPLIVNHEIVCLPSASVLGVLWREVAGRPLAPKTVAVFADPVFEKDDPRIMLGIRGQTSDPRPKTQDPRLKTQDSRPKTSDLKRQITDHGPRSPAGIEKRAIDAHRDGLAAIGFNSTGGGSDSGRRPCGREH
jgi:hypothetical protein